MARPRYIQGDVRPMKITVATALAVAIGDLVALVTNTAQKASGQAWNTSLAQTQTDFVTGFVGVSLQQKDANKARVFGNSEDNVIMVATGGVWEFDIAAATVEFGEYYGPAKDTGNALLDQLLVKVATEPLAVGQCRERGTTVQSVKIDLLSTLAKAARTGS